MKKKLFGAFALAALAVAVFAAARGNASGLSDAQLANVEALSRGEDIKPCHYVNGYSLYDLDKPDVLSVRSEFYDCCQVSHIGYNPRDKCM